MYPAHRYVGPRRNPGPYILDRESGVARGDDTVLLQAFQQAIDRLTTNADHHCEISLFRSPVALAISQADFSLPSLHPKIPFPRQGFQRPDPVACREFFGGLGGSQRRRFEPGQ